MKPPIDVKWIKAEKGEGLSIVYHDREGNQLIRRKDPAKGSLKGSKAWRHNNPGNLASGSHAKQHGAIGSASYVVINEEGKEQKYIFAIFPTYEIGRSAMVALLKEPRYLQLTLETLPRKYTGTDFHSDFMSELKYLSWRRNKKTRAYLLIRSSFFI